MTTQKATNSRDGHKRFTFRIVHRIGYDKLVDFLIHERIYYGVEFADYTRKTVLTEMRKHLLQEGSVLIDESDAREYRNGAAKTINKLFPELT